METEAEKLVREAPRFLHRWGFWAVLFGAVALILVFAQIAGPTLESRPSAASEIGQIAGEITRSAWRSFFGLKTEQPEAVTPSLWNYLAFAAPILGIVAIVLSLISGIRRENWRYAAYGASLGVAALVFQYLWWLAVLVMGVILLVSIIENISDIFSF